MLLNQPPGIKAVLVDDLNTLLNSICNSFCVSVHGKVGLCSFLTWFWYLGSGGFIECLTQCPSLLCNGTVWRALVFALLERPGKI